MRIERDAEEDAEENIERFCCGAALIVAGHIVMLSSVAGPLAATFNFLAYAALTLLLWIATRGRRPLAVPAGVIVLGACTLNPAVAAAAAALTASTLFFLQGKPVCAESSLR